MGATTSSAQWSSITGCLTAANWVYVWGHWPLDPSSALWLFHRRPAAYRELRLSFLLSGMIGVVVFALFPVAPPRLADIGLLDSVTRYSHAYRALQPRELTNIYAAFPSLHFGWDLLVGIALYRYATWRVVRFAGPARADRDGTGRGRDGEPFRDRRACRRRRRADRPARGAAPAARAVASGRSGACVRSGAA